MLDGLEKYVGREVSVVDVRRMTSGELDTIFELYQEKSGQELVKDGMDVIVGGIVKGLSYFLKFDDELALKNDLIENKTLRIMIGRSASKATEEYGDVVSVIKIVWDIAKHVVIETPKKEEEFDEQLIIKL